MTAASSPRRAAKGTPRWPGATTGAASRSTASASAASRPPRRPSSSRTSAWSARFATGTRCWRAGIPDQRVRARKVICGGHSLGGPLTAAFASWDFDGETRSDGRRRLQPVRRLRRPRHDARPRPRARARLGSAAAFSKPAQRRGPYINVPPLTPETFQVPAVFGVGTLFAPPAATDLLRSSRTRPTSTSPQRVPLLARRRELRHRLSGDPRLHGEQPADAGRCSSTTTPRRCRSCAPASASPTGGPFVDKNFPAPDGSCVPEEGTKRPLYSWVNYDKVGAAGSPAVPAELQRACLTRRVRARSPTSSSSRGPCSRRPRTSSSSTSRSASSPTSPRPAAATAAAASAASSHDGPSKKPALLVQAGDSDDNDGEDSGPAGGRAGAQRLPAQPPRHHASGLQPPRRPPPHAPRTTGGPEPASTALADFTLDVVPAPAIRLAVRPRRVTRGRPVRVRFHARSGATRCREPRRSSESAGRRVRTNRRGRAVLRLQLRRAGAGSE